MVSDDGFVLDADGRHGRVERLIQRRRDKDGQRDLEKLEEMNMAVFKNAEIRQGGNVIRVNVDVDGFVPIAGPSAGKYQWCGVLRPPNNTGLIRGETYTLLLPDYSPARIEVTDEANRVDGSVPFRGIGDMPERKAS